jgi:hypothetical protein
LPDCQEHHRSIWALAKRRTSSTSAGACASASIASAPSAAGLLGPAFSSAEASAAAGVLVTSASASPSSPSALSAQGQWRTPSANPIWRQPCLCCSCHVSIGTLCLPAQVPCCHVCWQKTRRELMYRAAPLNSGDPPLGALGGVSAVSASLATGLAGAGVAAAEAPAASSWLLPSCAHSHRHPVTNLTLNVAENCSMIGGGQE